MPQSALHRGTIGDVQWASPGTALIRVLDEGDYDQPVCRVVAAMEETIVHELVHLHLAFEPRMQKRGRSEEVIVSDISEALLRMNREQSDARCR